MQDVAEGVVIANENSTNVTGLCTLTFASSLALCSQPIPVMAFTGLLSDKCLVRLLRHWCKIGSDPKDAEEFVEEACKDGRILPNASTVNNLNKLWDTHDQLHV